MSGSLMGGWGYDPLSSLGVDSSNMTPQQYGSILNLGAGPSAGGSAGSGQFGFNLPTIGLGLQGIGALGSLYSDISQIGLAKKAYGLQKQVANANYTNQAQSYNTALSDRINSRGVQEGLSSDQINDYIKKNSVNTKM